MRFRTTCLLLSCILSIQFHGSRALGQQVNDQVATDVREPTEADPEEELLGEVIVSDYELLWPEIETHSRAIVGIAGNNAKWAKRFETGEQPTFNPLEEQFQAGRYRFRIEYIDNQAAESKQRRETAGKTRRELLAKRSELLDSGDPDGAKRALDEANEIRSMEMEISRNERQERPSRRRNRNISKTGYFQVNEDGTVLGIDLQAERIEQEKARRERAEHAEQSERENEDEPDL